MHFRVSIRILGYLLMMFSATMIPPLVCSWIFDDGYINVYFEAFKYTFLIGFVLTILFRRQNVDMRVKDGFLVTIIFYLSLGTFGALPFLLAPDLTINWQDAIFESFSGLTTTGATVLTGLDHMAPSLLYYRQQLQWLGGMGIIVLAVAILPMLGIGGMQLYRAETPGPVKDNKLTPRIKETALALWSIYVGLTLVCALCYWVAGMSFFDAVCHSFSTMAIGGFSTHDASIGYFQSQAIESVAIVFMILAGINFSLHFISWRDRSIRHYFRDDEVLFYLFTLGASALLVTFGLVYYGIYEASDALRQGLFQVVSIFTTTGFATAQFSQWPLGITFLIFLGAFAGACAGSTGGGLKVMRVLLIYKQGLREIHRLIHPHAVFPIKMNKRPVSTKVVEAVWGFFSIYVIAFLIMLLLLMVMGLDFISAFSAIGASINNLGPGLGDVAQNYASLSGPAKLLLCFAMTLGRLEIFPILVVFTPMFWKK